MLNIYTGPDNPRGTDYRGCLAPWPMSRCCRPSPCSAQVFPKCWGGEAPRVRDNGPSSHGDLRLDRADGRPGSGAAGALGTPGPAQGGSSASAVIPARPVPRGARHGLTAPYPLWPRAQSRQAPWARPAGRSAGAGRALCVSSAADTQASFSGQGGRVCSLIYWFPCLFREAFQVLSPQRSRGAAEALPDARGFRR